MVATYATGLVTTMVETTASAAASASTAKVVSLAETIVWVDVVVLCVGKRAES